MAEDLAKEFEADLEAITLDGEFDPDIDKFMTGQIIELWRQNSPEDSGDYKASIQVIGEAESGHGMVGATSEYANIIEYGSEDTPEFAPMRTTIEQINNGAL